MKCPKCGEEVAEFKRVWSDGPFTAKEAMPGLAAWGGYDVPRTVICETPTHVHFKFDHDGTERLVEMVPDLPEKREAIREHYEQMKHTCDKEGCDKDGWPGWTIWGDEEPVGWTCDDHAYEQGFCPVCHNFLAGLESFDFSPAKMCTDCFEELQFEMGEFDEEWDEEDYEWDF